MVEMTPPPIEELVEEVIASEAAAETSSQEATPAETT